MIVHSVTVKFAICSTSWTLYLKMKYQYMYIISACSCYPPGTLSAGVLSCDPVSGSCPCLPHVLGRQCDKCDAGYWNIDSGTGKSCDCVYCVG